MPRAPSACRPPRSSPSASSANTATWGSGDSSRISLQAVDVSVHRGEEALAEQCLLPAAGSAVPRARGHERVVRRVVVTERPLHSSEVHARERSHPHVADGLGLLDREAEARRAGLVVTGLTLRPTQRRLLIRLGLEVAAATRHRDRAFQVSHGVVEPSFEPGQLAEHRLTARVEPRVVDHREATLDLAAKLDRASPIGGRRRRAQREQRVRRAVPRRPVVAVESAGLRGELDRLREVTLVRDDVREVVQALRL